MIPEKIIQIFEVAKTFLKYLKPKSNILIVEDNADHADDLREYLEDIGRNCKIVKTAEEAKGALLNKRYKIIFIDIRLPLMGGIALIGHIKEHYPEISNVIVVGEVNDLYKFPHGTFVSIIIKPVTLSSVKETIKILD